MNAPLAPEVVGRIAMAMDTRKCVGCNACAVACKTENALPAEVFRDWVVIETRGAFPNLSQEIRSERCNHCSAPDCVTVCPTGASARLPDGTVIVDPDKCTGCKACIAACPYGARAVHPDGYVDKCTFCHQRRERGELPACVEVCPTESLVIGDLDDPDGPLRRLLAARDFKVLQPERGLHPNLFFLT